MSSDGKPIDMSRGMDESGLAMSMEMPAGMDMGDGMAPAAVDTAEQVAQFIRYNGWPELKEALIAGQVQAAMLLAPMAMDLADNGVPVRVVALGHRSGAVIMVKRETRFQTFADLKGARVAIPSRFAVDHIFVRRLMRKHGLADRDLTLVEMPPPDMPAALIAGAVDAYATGEPFGAKAEMDGSARVLYMTRDEWPTYICCVLVVRQELIESRRRLVQLLVDHVLSAGHWLDHSQDNRTRAAEVASDRSFFNQAVELIRWVMERPPDRVTYGDLRLIRDEFDELMRLSMDAGILKREIAYDRYVDESFMRNYRPVEINLR